MVQQRTVEERLQMIEERLQEIIALLRSGGAPGKQEPGDENLLTVKEVAKLIKIDAGFVYGACKKNEIPFIRLGKLYKFRKADVLEWMSAQQGQPDNFVDGYVDSYLQKHALKG